MARAARIVVPGAPHHVTQRGSRRKDVFFSESGRHLYLKLLYAYCAALGVTVVAYCLMTNHVDLVAVPRLRPRKGGRPRAHTT